MRMDALRLVLAKHSASLKAHLTGGRHKEDRDGFALTAANQYSLRALIYAIGRVALLVLTPISVTIQRLTTCCAYCSIQTNRKNLLRRLFKGSPIIRYFHYSIPFPTILLFASLLFFPKTEKS